MKAFFALNSFFQYRNLAFADKLIKLHDFLIYIMFLNFSNSAVLPAVYFNFGLRSIKPSPPCEMTSDNNSFAFDKLETGLHVTTSSGTTAYLAAKSNLAQYSPSAVGQSKTM